MGCELRRRTLVRTIAAGSVVAAAPRPGRATTGQQAVADGWPKFAHDPANSGHAPTHTGPTATITEQCFHL